MTEGYFKANFEGQLIELNHLADQIRAYHNTFNGFNDSTAQAVNIVRSIDIGIDKHKFAELLEDVALSLYPDPQSEFFALFFGNEWDTFIKMQADLFEQVEISKRIAKGSLATFDCFFFTKGGKYGQG